MDESATSSGSPPRSPGKGGISPPTPKKKKEADEELDPRSKRKSWLRHSWKDKGKKLRSEDDDKDKLEERREKKEKKEKGDKKDKSEKKDKGDKREKGEKKDQGDRKEKGEKKEKGERKEKGEKKDKQKGDKKDLTEKVIVAEEITSKQRKLESFLLSTAIKKLTGTTWKYFDVGKKKHDVIVLLPSGGVRPEAHFEMIMRLVEESYRVIAPWFPAVFTEMEDFVEGVVLILKHENISRGHVYGMSFGSMVAVHLTFLHPELVLSLILSHPILPQEGMARMCEKALKQMHHAPPWLQRILAGIQLKPKDIDRNVPSLKAGERELWMQIFKRFSIKKETMATRIQAAKDYHESMIYAPEDFDTFPGRVLIFASQDDEGYSERDFAEAKELFPQASIHLYHGTGYLLPIIRGADEADIVLGHVSESEVTDDDFSTTTASETEELP